MVIYEERDNPHNEVYVQIVQAPIWIKFIFYNDSAREIAFCRACLKEQTV